MKTVLVVDDEKPIVDALVSVLEYDGFRTVCAQNGKQALRCAEGEDVDLVLLDIKMPGMDGLEVLRRLKKTTPLLPVIMISGHGTIRTAVDAIKEGATDYIEKPPDADELLFRIKRAIQEGALRAENQALRRQLESQYPIVGGAAPILGVLEMVRQVAATDVAVLITGENGTGKELVARAIHNRSRRASATFVDVNCAAIPHELIESELFGHEAGSFTGASQRRLGKFEQASDGTIFLDEIGDMSEAAQAKILRVLETQEIQRVGGADKIRLDVRVIAATNKDLLAEVDKGSFRQDLYYRLNVFPINVPPLRERLDDLPELASHFLEAFCQKNDISPKRLAEGALAQLRAMDWPGNVRQLKNFVGRLAIMSSGSEISQTDVLRARESGAVPSDKDLFEICKTFEQFKEEAERRFLLKKLLENEWNIKKTSEAIDMQRSNLYKKIEKYKLK
jgi:two-component system nitrogen regulation response regulator NtrX